MKLLLTILMASVLASCAAPATLAPPGPAAVPLPAADGPRLDDPARDPQRWTYASGEAAGAAIQTWRALADFAIAQAARKPARSVPLGLPGVAGESPPRAAQASARR